VIQLAVAGAVLVEDGAAAAGMAIVAASSPTNVIATAAWVRRIAVAARRPAGR
jgi:hypothetical protein